jgi:hypothetical protein
MTLQEFKNLQVGDRITNPMSNSAGQVVRAETVVRGKHIGKIVAVKWDGTTDPFTFNDNQTVWMHWTSPFPEV